MNLRVYLRLVGFMAVLLIFPSLAAAQSSIKCESNNGRRNYCGNYDPSQVRFEKQISGSPCVQGRSWGVDGRGLWVDNGCRAYFRVRSGGNPNQGGGGYGGANPNGWWNRVPNDTWPPRGNWRGGNWGSGGACFYTDRGFGGRYFCMRRGEARPSLAGYGNQISSIRTFGGAWVIIFDGRNFSGARARFRGDQPNLQRMGVAQLPGHTWNNRISSLRVE
jgi:Protein of unknown function (DUF3011)